MVVWCWAEGWSEEVVVVVMRVVVMMISFHGQDVDIYTLLLFGTPAETAFNE
jgi:hypothetical protein